MFLQDAPVISKPVVHDQIAEDFRNAADLIRKYGWLQGNYGDFQRGFCTIGAVLTAAKLRAAYYHWNRLLKAINDGSSYDAASSITVWNDAPYRTKDEVLAMLEKAANNP